MAEWIGARREGDILVLSLKDRWIVAEAAALDRALRSVNAAGAKRIRIDPSGLAALDTAGAWLMLRLQQNLVAGGAEVTLQPPPEEYAPLMRQLDKRESATPSPPSRREPLIALLNDVGAGTVRFLDLAHALLGFFGMVVVVGLRAMRSPSLIRVTPMVAQMQRTGVTALGIVGLLSFLIGVVMAYQGADQLRPYGAEIYTVNLLGVSFFRELGGLMAAIIVAGRSGSAFAAEIGAMVVNEEVDAIRTLGLNPVDVLVLPRVVALVATLPLLTFYANIMGMLGGALMSWAVLDISFPAFLVQLRGAISLWSFWLGIIKAPFFAVSIALIGCNEGLSVARSAESVGRHTTQAVVQSIFLVIVFDAAFSVLFSLLRI